MSYGYLCNFVSAVMLLHLVVAQNAFPARAKSASEVAGQIRQTFENKLFQLEPDIQRHFAQRMYRITGDEKYAYPLIMDYLILEKRLRTDLDSLSNSRWVVRRVGQILESLDEGGRKGRVRRQLLEEHGEIPLYLDMLRSAYALEDYGVCDTIHEGLCAQARKTLGKVDFRAFLLNTAVIRAYSAQAVNYVYYLQQLGLGDFRTEYTQAFQRTFPDSRDNDLTNFELADKLYGLTHFITAASNYYQRPVDSLESGWILEYFERNRNRIFATMKADIVSEIGICFLLTGNDRSPLVEECQEFLLAEFDPDAGLIPSPTGGRDLDASEHRNIIAYMLLTWPWHVRPGPKLPDLRSFRTIFCR